MGFLMAENRKNLKGEIKMDISRMCPHCMRKMPSGAGDICVHCGKNIKEFSEITHQLKPYTILQGKYLVGDVLGEGGFGITYIGFDLNLEMRVAIKEFYPNGYATREANVTSKLTVYNGQNHQTIIKWRDSLQKNDIRQSSSSSMTYMKKTRI